MAVTSEERSIRRQIVVCVLLLAGLAMAGVALPAPRAARTGGVAAPATTTTAPPVEEGPTTTTTTTGVPTTTAAPGAPTPTTAPAVGPGRDEPTEPTTTTEAPSPTTTAPATACGAPLRKAGGGTWRCTFDDEFDGTSVDRSKWRVQETSWNGFIAGPVCFMDDQDNVSVSGGAVHLTAHREASAFRCNRPRKPFTTQFTSGMLTSYGKFTQAYGRWEVRAQFPTTGVKGLQSSVWLWPENPTKYGSVWPASGEIDIAEAFSRYPDRVIPYLHYVGPGDSTTNNYCMVDDLGAWHTYAIEWTTQSITFLYDGATCLVAHWSPVGLRYPAPFDSAFMISLTQGLGVDRNEFDPNLTPLPATTSIDYVRVWR